MRSILWTRSVFSFCIIGCWTSEAVFKKIDRLKNGEWGSKRSDYTFTHRLLRCFSLQGEKLLSLRIMSILCRRNQTVTSLPKWTGYSVMWRLKGGSNDCAKYLHCSRLTWANPLNGLPAVRCARNPAHRKTLWSTFNPSQLLLECGRLIWTYHLHGKANYSTYTRSFPQPILCSLLATSATESVAVVGLPRLSERLLRRFE